MVASIGKVGSPSQGVSYFEKEGYYAKDDPLHREANDWYGKGAESMGLSGPVEPEAFEKVLEGHVPGGRRLGRRERDGTLNHRPGVDVKLSAPKSVSLAALVDGDRRIVKAHDKAVKRTLDWIEERVSDRGQKRLRGKMSKTVPVLDEASLAYTGQMRDLLKAATAMRLPRVVLVGDEKQLDRVDAGKPFEQLMESGMRTAVMDEILRQKDVKLKSAVVSTLEGEIRAAFKKLGDNVTEIDRDAGLVNGQIARVAGIEEDAVRFELEDVGTITLGVGHPSMRFLDHACATTIHSFRGRTVDTNIAAMESGIRATIAGYRDKQWNFRTRGANSEETTTSR